MSAEIVQREVERVLAEMTEGVGSRRRKRLGMVVSGMLAAGSACPTQIARGVSQRLGAMAQVPSIERRIRRWQNDEQIRAANCLHPVVRQQLRQVPAGQELVLILDPTTKRDRQVVLMAAVWYRGRALPVAWDSWPGNVSLKGRRFWERVESLLDVVGTLLPAGVTVVWLADRAFGCPAFTDLIRARGWHYVVRLQGQTRYQDHHHRERTVRSLVGQVGQRTKGCVALFKKAGWRSASVLVYWGKRHRQPWCLASSLPPSWRLIRLYQQRFAIEPLFRDYKSHGWHFEQVQVRDPAHLERLLVAMALATWLAMILGAFHARHQLSTLRPTRQVPHWAKLSLFQNGLAQFSHWLAGSSRPPPTWSLPDWDAPAWHDQVRFRCGFLFVLINPLAKTVRP